LPKVDEASWTKGDEASWILASNLPKVDEADLIPDTGESLLSFAVEDAALAFVAAVVAAVVEG